MVLTEMPSKRAMSPLQIKMLRCIAERKWESTKMYLQNMTGAKQAIIDKAIDCFASCGLIRFTGGGEFVISEKGIAYLKQVHGENLHALATQ